MYLAGDIVIQEDNYGIRGHFSGGEENQGKLRGVQGDDVGVLPPSPYEEVTQNIPATEQVDRQWWRRTRYIQGAIYVGIDVNRVPGRRMTGKDKKTREAYGKNHVSTLEVEGDDPTVGTGTSTKM